ncbi:unnamed protein product [Effrenium voratum]|nr:unnamed protein product [Effrenium voratum]
MPYEIGVPFVEEARIESCEGTSVHLRLTFFPGGHTAAPPNHVSLWVLPLHGLEELLVHRGRQRGSALLWRVRPALPPGGGLRRDINLSVCRLPSPDAPRRLRRFSETS